MESSLDTKMQEVFLTSDSVRHYKAQVVSYIEYRTVAILHANLELLRALDSIQTRFLINIKLTIENALRDYSLAPLSARRDIVYWGFFTVLNLVVVPRNCRSYSQ